MHDFLDAALVFKGLTIALVGVQRGGGGGGCQPSEPFHIFLEEIVWSSSAVIHKERNLVERMPNWSLNYQKYEKNFHVQALIPKRHFLTWWFGTDPQSYW